MTKLVLFDIDYTLIRIKNVMGRFLPPVVKEIFGLDLMIDQKYHKIKVAGKTDRSILMNVLKECGITNDLEKKLHILSKEYAKAVGKGLEKSLEDKVLPGVIELLERLKREGMILGIVTGNMKKTSEVKLKRSKLWDYFEVFGFGDNTEIRSDVVKYVVKGAERKFRMKFEGKDIVIIGDTPHDIECAKPFRAKTIAVLTGPYPFEELKERKPDHILNDLTETEKIVKIIKNSG